MADIYREGDYRGVDWSGKHLIGHRFERCAFGDADLLELATEQVVFEECDFAGARLNASDHVSTAFLRCRFLRTSLFDARLAGCKLVGSVFEGPCVLKPLRVEGGDWSYVSLRAGTCPGSTCPASGCTGPIYPSPIYAAPCCAAAISAMRGSRRR
jgi:fluoroquinolone resistance protein